MIIETERLEIVALTASQLRLWVEDTGALENELNCVYRAEPMEGFFLEIVKGQLAITESDPENYMWHSFWFLVRKSDRLVVGAADFKDVPNTYGEVEIGYGLGTAFEHNGYMTEAVKAMCEWAAQQKNVLHVTAETEADGLASQRILQNCGFTVQSTGQTIWWKL